MRKLLLVTGIAGLVMGGALLTGTPASADIGCSCVKLGETPVCVASIEACTSGMGGVCIAPCDYKPSAMKKDKMKKKKKM